MNVDERARLLLKRVVEQYIAEGKPVASKLLASQPGIQLSSATVRNIMADLDAKGLVRSPHTSAGKVPTSLGLRFFVDSLISIRPMEESDLAQLRSELNPDLSPRELAESASNLMSHLTRMTCLVTLPRRENSALRHVEFLPLTGLRVLVILVLNDREVQNRVIHTDREYQQSELTEAANYINQEFGGLSIENLRAALLDSMRQDKERMNQMMQTALEVASRALAGEDDEAGASVVVSGESALLDLSSDTNRLRALFETFSHKGAILHLLDRCLDTEGIQLFIGQDSGHGLEGVSMVTASYEVNGQMAGVLGVVGPTRMAYQEIIPVVDVTARMLSAALHVELHRS